MDCCVASGSPCTVWLAATRGIRAASILFPKPPEKPPMDRRTILAFVLIFLIVIGSDFVMRRMRSAPVPPQDQPVPAEQTPANPPDDRAPAAAASAAEFSSPVPAVVGVLSPSSALAVVEEDAAERLFVVETPLYRAEISSLGARIVSWQSLVHLDAKDQPVELLPQGDDAARQGDDAITFENGTIEIGRVNFSNDGPAQLNVLSQTGSASLVLRARTAGDLEIRKTYTFDPENYTMLVDLEVVAAGPRAGDAARLVGLPVSARFGWPQGIASTERISSAEQAAFKSFARVGDDLHAKNRKDLSKGVEKVAARFTGSVRFAVLQNKYFTVAGILPPGPGQTVEGTVVLSGDPARHQLTWAIEAPLRAPSAGNGVIAASRLTTYIGPQDAERLRAFGLGLEKTLQLGWTLFRPVAEGVLWILDHMYRVIPNYGVVIILFSVIMKLVFWPLTRSSTQSMKKMQALQPKIQELQQKYKDNREKLSQETMKLYQKEKVNPMAGCLPLLVQMPVFIALYQALANTIVLRNAPFTLWMNDLSQPDALFLLPFSLPFLGNEFNVLPILMGASMWVQTKITPTANIGGQMALMNTLMPVIFLFMFYQMPSGLVLYWLVVNIMSIYQTWRIHTTAPRTGGVEAA
jgi:YidC/Oxa1 family membrane protein insertase